MHSRKNSSNEAMDKRLDALLSKRESEVSSDFLASLREQIASEDEVAAVFWGIQSDQADKKLDQMLAKQVAPADETFLETLRKRIDQEELADDNENRRSIRFPVLRWAMATAAVVALGLAGWMQIIREDQAISPTVANHVPEKSELNLGNVQAYDSEITQILALAQNLDPNQELRSLDADRLQSFLLSSY